MHTGAKSLIWIIGVATVGALFVRFFLVEDFRVASNSMAPNLLAGDLVFVSKAHYNLQFPFSSFEIIHYGNPKRGDVVALSVPEKPGQTFIKRVTAIGGDKVEIKGGKLYINDKQSQYTPAKPKAEPQKTPLVVETLGEKAYSIGKMTTDQNYGPVLVPDKHFFVLGDNRSDSVDSRSWGPVPNSYLKGRAWFVWLSIDPEGSIRKGRWAIALN